MTGSGNPEASGNITKVSGTGDAVIAFSAYTFERVTWGVYNANYMQRGMAWWDSGANKLRVKTYAGNNSPANYDIHIATNYPISVSGAAYTTLRHLGVQYSWGAIVSASEFIVFEDCTFNVGKVGVYLTDSDDCTFRRCIFTNIGFSFWDHGLYIESGSRTTITECTFDGCSDGFQLYGSVGPADCVVNRNIVKNVVKLYEVKNFTDPATYPNPANDGVCGFPQGLGGHIISDNIFVGPYQMGLACNASNLQITNNTFYSASSLLYGAILSGTAIKTGNVIANNIFDIGNSRAIYINDTSFSVINNNCYYNVSDWTDDYSTSLNWAQWKALGWDANSFNQDPLMVNPGAADYGLQAGSPCLLTADDTYLTTPDYLGITRFIGVDDIGALQRSGLSYCRYAAGSPLPGVGNIVGTYGAGTEATTSLNYTGGWYYWTKNSIPYMALQKTDLNIQFLPTRQVSTCGPALNTPTGLTWLEEIFGYEVDTPDLPDPGDIPNTLPNATITLIPIPGSVPAVLTYPELNNNGGGEGDPHCEGFDKPFDFHGMSGRCYQMYKGDKLFINIQMSHAFHCCDNGTFMSDIYINGTRNGKGYETLWAVNGVADVSGVLKSIPKPNKPLLDAYAKNISEFKNGNWVNEQAMEIDDDTARITLTRSRYLGQYCVNFKITPKIIEKNAKGIIGQTWNMKQRLPNELFEVEQINSWDITKVITPDMYFPVEIGVK
jgi:hypothetical protein